MESTSDNEIGNLFVQKVDTDTESISHGLGRDAFVGLQELDHLSDTSLCEEGCAPESKRRDALPARNA